MKGQNQWLRSWQVIEYPNTCVPQPWKFGYRGCQTRHEWQTRACQNRKHISYSMSCRPPTDISHWSDETKLYALRYDVISKKLHIIRSLNYTTQYGYTYSKTIYIQYEFKSQYIPNQSDKDIITVNYLFVEGLEVDSRLDRRDIFASRSDIDSRFMTSSFFEIELAKEFEIELERFPIVSSRDPVVLSRPSLLLDGEIGTDSRPVIDTWESLFRIDFGWFPERRYPFSKWNVSIWSKSSISVSYCENTWMFSKVKSIPFSRLW